MKNIFLLIALFSLSITAQNKYLTKTGSVHFEASVPSFEEVAAKNNTVTAILNTENGEFAALVLVKGFRFKNALMEEHFNENYAESDQFPKATFKGSLQGFSIEALEASSTLKLNGSLTFHGETQTLENIAINVSKKDDVITFTGRFKAKASDYNIKIPKVVSSKIAEDIDIDFNFELKKK